MPQVKGQGQNVKKLRITSSVIKVFKTTHNIAYMTQQ